MSRRSIDTRMDRIIDQLLPPGSMKRREYFLSDHLRAALDYHRSRTASYISAAEKTNPAPGAVFAAMLDDRFHLPIMPQPLRDALDMPEPPAITAAMSDEQVADLWRTFAFGDEL